MIILKRKKLTTAIFSALFFLISVSVLNPMPARAFNLGNARDFLDEAANFAGYDTSKTDPADIVSLVIKGVLSILGVIFLILMIYAGYLWMTAAGDQEKVSKSKNLIRAAIIGLCIVIGAYVISYFVLGIVKNMLTI